MGLSSRKKSGKLIAGSTMIVPGQPILSAKKFEITFSNKVGSIPDTKKERIIIVQPTPEPTITPTPTVTPTPTSSNTPTPTPTPSITPTMTVTPTPTSTPLPPEIVFFEDCCNGDIYKIGNVPTLLTPINTGSTYFLTSDTFTGCTTVVTATTFNYVGLYTSSTLENDCLDCYSNNSYVCLTPTPTVTPTITPTPTVTPTPTPTELNGGSILLDRVNNNYLSITGSTSWAVGTGDFTVESFIYQINNGSQNYIFSLGTTNNFALSLSSGGNKINCYMGGVLIAQPPIAATINTWNHIAISRVSGTYNVYYNGIRLTSVSNSTNITDITSPFQIGVLNSALPTSDNWPGNMTNFRFIKGTAIYTGTTYTVPTSPLLPISGTELLLRFKTAGTFLNDDSGTNKVAANNGSPVAVFSTLTPF